MREKNQKKRKKFTLEAPKLCCIVVASFIVPNLPPHCVVIMFQTKAFNLCNKLRSFSKSFSCSKLNFPTHVFSPSLSLSKPLSYSKLKFQTHTISKPLSCSKLKVLTHMKEKTKRGEREKERQRKKQQK